MKISFKHLVLLISLFVVALYVYFSYFRHESSLPQRVTINVDNQPTLGNQNAPIQIVAFEDLKCVNCKQYNATLYPVIYEKYIKTGLAKYVFINLGFLEGSLPAANAARCVYDQGNALFFKYIETIFSNQPPESEDWATIPKLMTFADQVPGINKSALLNCISKNPYNQLIKNNFKMADKVMQGTVETPTLFVNGYIVRPLTISRIDYIIGKSKHDS